MTLADANVRPAQEVRHQALRLADRQPRHPRTVPPEEELVRTRGAGTSGSFGAQEGPSDDAATRPSPCPDLWELPVRP